MSPTCRPDTVLSANFSRKGMSQRHKTCKKRPRHTQFYQLQRQFKSVQMYWEYVWAQKQSRIGQIWRHVGAGCDMSSNVMSFQPPGRHNIFLCRRHDQDMSPTRHTMSANEGSGMGKTRHKKTFPAKSIGTRDHTQIHYKLVCCSHSAEHFRLWTEQKKKLRPWTQLYCWQEVNCTRAANSAIFWLLENLILAIGWVLSFLTIPSQRWLQKYTKWLPVQPCHVQEGPIFRTHVQFHPRRLSWLYYCQPMKNIVEQHQQQHHF